MGEVPSLGEVAHAVSTLKNNKSPGPDSLPAELLKYGGERLAAMLHELIALIWEKEIILHQWKDANLIKLYMRKGDQAVCTNSRGIALFSTAGKVLAKVLCKSLITHIVEKIVTETQWGFRPDRSTADMIFVARQFFWE